MVRDSELRVCNTIFLMHLAANAYARKHHMTRQEFLSFDRRFHVLRYVSNCPDVFDAMPEDMMIGELEDYVARSKAVGG